MHNKVDHKDDFILVSLSNTPQKAIRILGKEEKKEYAQAIHPILFLYQKPGCSMVDSLNPPAQYVRPQN